jgi:hypothetical protein
MSHHDPRGRAVKWQDLVSVLHMIPQHQFLVMRVPVHLLVRPVGHRVVIVEGPSYKTGLKRQTRFPLTARMLISK